MNGEFGPYNPENEEKAGKAPEFDSEAELERRKEIRKLLTKEISESAGSIGFKKAGNSVWYSEVENKRHILALERSQWSHEYYLEAGICNIPEDETIKPDITKCGTQRESIEYIVSHLDFSEEQRKSNDPKIKKAIFDREEEIRLFFDFEEPGIREKYPNEYSYPSVALEESQQKIEKVGEIVETYISKWFSNVEGLK